MRSVWWINFIKCPMEQEIFNPGDEIQMECLCLSFAQLLQDDLDKVKQH